MDRGRRGPPVAGRDAVSAPPRWPPTWAASWIWSEAPPDAPMLGPAGAVPEHLWNRSARLRTVVVLDDVPTEAWCRVSADSRFVLWVNGVEVARGPARSVPERLAWVDVDLGPQLREGENVVAALCRFYGAATPWWRPGQPLGQLGYGNFALECPALGLGTDDGWRAGAGPFLTAPDGAHRLLEHVDGAVMGDGWTEPGYDDSAWTPAVVLTTIGVGTRSQRLPVAPYTAMEPGAIAPLTRTRRHGAPVASGTVAAGDRDPVGLYAEGVAGGGDPFVTFDLGTMTIGTPWATVTVPAGTIVDVYAGEDVSADGLAVIPPRSWAMRWVAAGGPDEAIESYEPVGHRYVTVVVRGGTEGSVSAAGAVERRYPTGEPGAFACDDDGLTAVWAVGVRTLELCSVDAFVDCPGREQQAWTGDAYVHALLSLVGHDDWRLVRRYLRLAAQSVRADGFLPMAAACGTAAGPFNIPEYSLHWIRALRRYHLHSGDLDTARELLPIALGVLDAFERYRGDDGLLHHLAGIVFVDWAQTRRDDITLAVDGLLAAATLDTADLLEWVSGDAGYAAQLRKRQAAIAAGFELLWDGDRRAYVDAATDGGRPHRRLSQITNALAVVGRCAPRERWDAVLDTVLDPARVKRTLSNGDLPAAQHWSYQWWDPAESVGFDDERHVVEAQPWAARFLHEALVAAERWDDLVASCRRWTAQLDRGNTTFEEFWDAPPGTTSRCHAWSASPTWDLSSSVLGVTPLEPGYARARIQPRFAGGLTRVTGRVPSPLGFITVDASAAGAATVAVPAGIRAEVVLGGATTEVTGPSTWTA